MTAASMAKVTVTLIFMGIPPNAFNLWTTQTTGSAMGKLGKAGAFVNAKMISAISPTRRSVPSLPDFLAMDVNSG